MSDFIDTANVLGLSETELGIFCRKWKIRKLELFGSILTQRFGNQSDVDFLVTFLDGVGPDLFDFVELREELQALVHRTVDIVDRETIERSDNRIRREAILSKTRILYDRAA